MWTSEFQAPGWEGLVTHWSDWYALGASIRDLLVRYDWLCATQSNACSPSTLNLGRVVTHRDACLSPESAPGVPLWQARCKSLISLECSTRRLVENLVLPWLEVSRHLPLVRRVRDRPRHVVNQCCLLLQHPGAPVHTQVLWWGAHRHVLLRIHVLLLTSCSFPTLDPNKYKNAPAVFCSESMSYFLLPVPSRPRPK